MVVRELIAKLGFKVDKKSAGDAGLMFTELRSKMELLIKGAELAKDFINDLLNETVGYAKEMQKLSTITGVGVEALQELRFAAKESWVEFDSFESAMMRMTRNGIQNPEKHLWQLVDSFEHVKDPAARAQMAVAAFGRGGQAMIPFLAKGKKEIKGLIDEAHELGIVMGREDLEAAKNVNDGLKKFHATVEGLKRTIAGPFLRAGAGVLKTLNDWLRLNRAIIASKVQWVVEKLVSAMHMLWSIGEMVVKGWQALSSMLGEWAVPALLAAAAVIVAMSESSTILALKWLFFGFVIAAIAEDIYRFFTNQSSLLGDLINKYADWADGWTPGKFAFLEKHPVLAFLHSVLEGLLNIKETLRTAADFYFGAPPSRGGRAGVVPSIPFAGGVGADENDTMAAGWRRKAQGGEDDLSAYQARIHGSENDPMAARLRPLPGPTYQSSQSSGGAYAPQISVTVNAQTGADANDIASLVGQTIDTRLDAHYRDAQMALAPGT